MATAPVQVLHIITRMVRGGAQQVLLDLLRGLDRQRFAVSLAAGVQTGPEGSLWGEIERLGIPVWRVGALVREIAPVRDLRALSRLSRIIADLRPTIVHCHTSKAGLLGCLAARRARVPGIVLSPHGHLLAPAAQIPGVPQRGMLRQMIAGAARHSARLADVVIAPNTVERDDGIRHGVWRADQSVTVPNGVDTQRFVPRALPAARVTLGWPLTERIVGVVARLTREKGIDIAIEAMTHLPGVQLVVAGDGPERAALEALALRLGLAPRVTFFGVTERVEELLPALDALLIPSRTEAHGMVAAEALACRVPIIAANIGGLRSLVIDRHTGLLFPPGDPAALATTLLRLFEDEALAQRLAFDGQRYIEDHFSLPRMVRTTEEVYLQLAARTPPTSQVTR